MGWAEIGWPLVAVAIAAFGVAFATRHRWIGFAAALIAAPLCFYLTDMPYLHWASLVALFTNFGSATALWRGRHDIAFAMLLPLMITIVISVILWFRNFSVFAGFHF